MKLNMLIENEFSSIFKSFDEQNYNDKNDFQAGSWLAEHQKPAAFVYVSDWAFVDRSCVQFCNRTSWNTHRAQCLTDKTYFPE